MKKIFFTIFSLIFISIFSLVHALEAPSNVTLLSSTDNSLELTWDQVSWAYGYYLFYWKTQWNNWLYDNEVEDIIDSNKYKLENLEPSTTYYVSITSINENGDESNKSQEYSFTTKVAWDNWSGQFWLQEIEILSLNQISVTFNSELDSSENAIRDFRLIDKSTWEDLNIDSYDLDDNDNSKILITISPDMNNDTDYELTVIDIEDIDWRTIESWVKWVVLFTIPKDFTWEEWETIKKIIDWWVDYNNDVSGDPLTKDSDWDGVSDFNEKQAWTDPYDSESKPWVSATIDDNNTNLKVTWDDGTELNVTTGDNTELSVNNWNDVDLNAAGVDGTNISDTELAASTAQTASATNKLPQTWPESIFLILIAIFWWLVVFFFSRRKKV